MQTLALDPAEVHRIAVFRALMLGDLLCATPALRALRHAYPAAEITLVGLPWAQTLAQRLPVDAFLPFPGYPGLPEAAPQLAALPPFLAQAQAARYDLALQLHGSGTITNPLVASFGARRNSGFFQPGQFCPDPALYTPWPATGHEIERCLAVTDALGVARQGLAIDFPLAEEDHERLLQQAPALADEPYLVLHAGAQLRSRRWPLERFARVANALASEGWRVVLTGTPGEAALGQALQQACSRHAARLMNLIGRTDLWSLGALLQRAQLLVGNDTGLSHIAAALGTPSVIVSLGADVQRWAPLDRQRHHVLWQDLPCRPCGHPVCPQRHECATAIGADAVIEAAFDQLHRYATREPTWQPLPSACASSPGMSTATTSGT